MHDLKGIIFPTVVNQGEKVTETMGLQVVFFIPVSSILHEPFGHPDAQSCKMEIR